MTRRLLDVTIVNVNTFRQLGIAIGIAGLAVVFERRIEDAAAGEVGERAAFVEGPDAIFLLAGLVALAAVPLTLWLLRKRPAPG